MKPDKGVGVVPVSSRAIVFVYQGNCCIGFGDNRIRKSQSHGAATDDEIINLYVVRCRQCASPIQNAAVLCCRSYVKLPV